MARRRPWIQDIDKPSLRVWEEGPRDRFAAERVVRTTHAVNCGGGCEMEVGVRRDRIVFERPAVPAAPAGTLPGGPRCCTPGLCAASYVDDDARVLYPLVRESLLEAWQQARTRFQDPVRAWASLLEQPALVQRWQQARGHGGFRRTNWQTAEELVAAGLLHTLKTSGPGRIAGVTSSPAPALVSAASGLRFLHLLGGVEIRGKDGEEPVRRVFQETWGEQYDAPEAAAWGESEMIAVWGADPFATMSPDARHLVLARQRGARVWALTDVQDGTSVRCDCRIRLAPEKAGVFWSAVTRCLLARYFSGTGDGPFHDYVRRFTDAPLLVELRREGDNWMAAGLVEGTVSSARTGDGEEGRAFLAWDESTGRPVMLQGCVGGRGQLRRGQWNLRLESAETGMPIVPRLSMADQSRSVPLRLVDALTAEPVLRPVPAREMVSSTGVPVQVTTVLDLLLAYYGIPRGLALQDGESIDALRRAAEECGVGAATIERFAQEWGETARRSDGRCLALIGPDGVRNAASPRVLTAIAHALILTGCMGRQGGGFGYYSGQQKVILSDSWSLLSRARDWVGATRTATDSPARVMFRWGLDPTPGQAPAGDWSARGHSRLGQPSPNAGTDGPDGPPELMVNLSFRIDPSALSADVVLPAATWYERSDLNSAERPGSIQAVVPVVAPRGESMSEWQIFRRLARRFSELASIQYPDPVADPVAALDGRRAGPEIVTVQRAYRELAERFETLGPERPNPVFAPPVAPASTDRSPRGEPGRRAGGLEPDFALGDPVGLADDAVVCDTLLRISSATDGAAAFRLFGRLERETGLELRALVESQRLTRITWSDLIGSPRRPLITPLWSGIPGARPYVPFALNVGFEVPWRTATGRQQLLAGLPLGPATDSSITQHRPSEGVPEPGQGLRLRFRLVADKWSVGTLFAERRSVGALSRGPSPVWISPGDATLLDVQDNDWIELHFHDGSSVVRCVVSRAVPSGVALGCAGTYPFAGPDDRRAEMLWKGGPSPETITPTPTSSGSPGPALPACGEVTVLRHQEGEGSSS